MRAHCLVDRDVFYTEVSSPGPMAVGQFTLTNHDASWFAHVKTTGGLTLWADPGSAYMSELDLWTNHLAPGTYTVGSTGSFTAEIQSVGAGCGVSTGTITIDELTAQPPDSNGDSRVSAFSAVFDFQCPWSPAPVGVRGCVRYSAADGGPPVTVPDAGIDFSSIPQMAACLASPYEIQVVANDYGGLNGPYGVDGTQGTWSGRLTSEAIMQLDVAAGAGWSLAAASDLSQALKPGTYSVPGPDGRFPYASLKVDGGGCQGSPSGTFTIVDIGSTGSDQASLTRLAAWFDFSCGGGRLTGCVRYAE